MAYIKIIMKQIDALKILESSHKRLFRLCDLKKVLHLSDNSIYVQLNRLTKAGVLTRIRKDVYCLQSKKIDDFEIANYLGNPSYVSLESALAYYGIILQVPQIILSITPRRANHITIENKEFAYSHIDRRYYFGYERNENFLIATREKAIIDVIFFATFGKAVINFDEWTLREVNMKNLNHYASKIKNPLFQKLFKKVFQ